MICAPCAVFQAYFQSMLCMQSLGVPFKSSLPWQATSNQRGFGTFGAPALASMLADIATKALKAQWYQKWCEGKSFPRFGTS